MNLLHITAHLGGGVGKVLSRLVEESARRGDGVRHTIACLERPEKGQFVEKVLLHGGELLVTPGAAELNRAIAGADIVQLEWWHHPVVAGWLCGGPLPPMRLLVWSHVSGLHPPVLPPAFLAFPHRFLFTSPCSWQHPALAALEPALKHRVAAVFSSGGFDDLPEPPKRSYAGPLSAGYLGTLNFAKLHPRFLDFLRAVTLPEFRVALVGDPTTAAQLMSEANARGVSHRIELRGYRTDVAEQLAGFDVMPYLLNPLHYGTTENALLESMAMGVVPIVLDNPTERILVEHGETGLVVDSPASFSEALSFLSAHRGELARLSANGQERVRRRLSVQATADALAGHYAEVLQEEKRTFDARGIFGPEPADWFRACQGEAAQHFADGPAGAPAREDRPHYLFEKTKGSVFHFRDTFPGDLRLRGWAERLQALQHPC